jgi:hypothetical protein
MTVEEFTIHVGALVMKAQASGISVAQEISVLNGVLDELKDGRRRIDSRADRAVMARTPPGGEVAEPTGSYRG